eukprot:CAMPEP_0171134234 /NCGR_PEP_ID=MMETSP0766_2-20121228/127668_1 /TAXON_ID=439317 /ORGANISM="Gambierdiscus australes, Strain CAWD 149" /LENGTH=77 /DNA_ID=CAMNT_0011597665 /DNA_START=17 /DNA_END=247 /DNA_ORIENTATION=+
MGVAAFGVASVHWAQAAFGWAPRDCGGFFALGSFMQVVSNAAVLPSLAEGTRGNAPLMLQICLAVSAFKFAALGLLA